MFKYLYNHTVLTGTEPRYPNHLQVISLNIKSEHGVIESLYDTL